MLASPPHRMTTPLYSVGSRHIFRPGSESLPNGYSGYYYILKHPKRHVFDDVVRRLTDAGIIQVL